MVTNINKKEILEKACEYYDYNLLIDRDIVILGNFSIEQLIKFKLGKYDIKEFSSTGKIHDSLDDAIKCINRGIEIFIANTKNCNNLKNEIWSEDELKYINSL